MIGWVSTWDKEKNYLLVNKHDEHGAILLRISLSELEVRNMIVMLTNALKAKETPR